MAKIFRIKPRRTGKVTGHLSPITSTITSQTQPPIPISLPSITASLSKVLSNLTGIIQAVTILPQTGQLNKTLAGLSTFIRATITFPPRTGQLTKTLSSLSTFIRASGSLPRTGQLNKVLSSLTGILRGSSSSITSLKMGFNFNDQQWTSQNLYWQEQAQGSSWSYVDGSNNEFPIPAAYLDSDNWPCGMPPGAAFLSKAITGIPTDMSKTMNVTYDGVISTVLDWQSTHSGFTSGTGTLVANNFMNAGLPPAFRYTIAPAHYAVSLGGDGNYPRNIHIRPAGTTADEFDPLTASQIDAVTNNGTARFMDATGVNFNGGPSVGGGSSYEEPWGGGTQASPAWKIDVANLNSYTSGQWTESHLPGAKKNAGYPISALVNFCNARNLNLHYTVNWNMSPAAQAVIADYIVANLNSNLKAYVEVANEVWNFGFAVASQARDEAKPMNRTGGVGLPVMGNPLATTDNSSGGSGERYCEKVKEVMSVFSARWAASGRTSKPTLRRCLAIQHAGGGGTAATFLDYMPDHVTPVNTYIDCLMSAPYFDPFEVNPDTYSGTYLQIINDLYTATDLVVSRCAAIKAACDARGIEYAFYEYGPSLYVGSGQLALSQQIHRSSEMKTWLKYTLQRTLGAVGSATCAFYGFCNAIGTNFGTWEVLEYAHQDAATAPKYQAIKDHVHGIHSLVPLVGPMIAKTGTSAGAVVGIIRRRNPGSTVTLSEPKLGFADTTAQDLHVVIIDPSVSLTDGTNSVSITETDSRDPASPSTTTLNLLRTSSCVWLPNTPHVAEFDISPDGMTVTRYTGTGGDKQIFGSIKRSNGCVEFVPSRVTGNTVIGFANDNHSLVNFIGGDGNSFGWYSNGSFLLNGGSVSPWPSWTATDKPFIYISGTGKAYGTKNGSTWYPAGSNPNTDTGGVDVSSALGTGVRPAMDIVGLGSIITGHFTNSTYVTTKPAGSNDWS